MKAKHWLDWLSQEEGSFKNSKHLWKNICKPLMWRKSGPANRCSTSPGMFLIWERHPHLVCMYVNQLESLCSVCNKQSEWRLKTRDLNSNLCLTMEIHLESSNDMALIEYLTYDLMRRHPYFSTLVTNNQKISQFLLWGLWRKRKIEWRKGMKKVTWPHILSVMRFLGMIKCLPVGAWYRWLLWKIGGVLLTSFYSLCVHEDCVFIHFLKDIVASLHILLCILSV